MNSRNNVARVLATVGAILLFATAALHLSDYPKDTSALPAANLNPRLQAGFRAVFLLVGCDWIIIAIVALVAVFIETRLSKLLVLFCGVAVLVETVLTLALMGVFLGNEMIGSAALLLIIAGLLFERAKAG
jgi:hypothetical protein